MTDLLDDLPWPMIVLRLVLLLFEVSAQINHNDRHDQLSWPYQGLCIMHHGPFGQPGGTAFKPHLI
ncbi:hypothetical protein CVT25_012976 [Psilocybe cyanescens]|uniref:Secreted protein n=1 Tax=Psilocybe cyanescens TaxID=93625 RepID=A0A409VU11_PSICY|nr:hypothetical protein CVT25_012976 [Psilocybe cyanescens]